MDTLLQDIRYALRMLLKRPGFTLVAVIALGLGIGANTTIFSLLNALLIRPLPVDHPEQLVSVSKRHDDGSSFHSFSIPSTRDLRQRSKLVDLAAYSGMPMSLNTGSGPEITYGYIVSGNYFSVLGLTPAAGRFFVEAEDSTAGTHPVAVISYSFWQSRFDLDKGVVGREIVLNGDPFTVIGVAPEKFNGTMSVVAAPIWIPTMMIESAKPDLRSSLFSRNISSMEVFGRLKPGESVASAAAELEGIARSLAQEFDAQSEGAGIDVEEMSGLRGQMRGDVTLFLGILMGVAALVLLIACINVSSMLLARSLGRRKEMGIRVALGASRSRLVRQLLVESTLLFLLGGTGGVLLAFWTTDMLLAFKPPGGVPLDIDLSVDLFVLGFTLLISLLTGTLFGLVPAIPASRQQVIPSLADAPGGSGRSRLRDMFVVAQVAFSLLVLVCAGLFLRTLDNAQSADPGFDPDGLYVMSLQPSLAGYEPEKESILYNTIAERIDAMGNVESVAFTENVPLGPNTLSTTVVREGERTPDSRPTHVADVTFISHDYFRTMGLPIVKGRNFSTSDRQGSPRVAIINEEMAKRFWPGEDPIGKRISQESTTGPFLEVIGVAKNGKYRSLEEEQLMYLYLPVSQEPRSDLKLLIRTRPGTPTPLNDVRAIIGSIDPNLPVYDAMSMWQSTAFSLLPQQMAATVTALFGLLGVTLAAIGIYGLVAYSVARRTREIGIRAALGAGSADLLKMILRQGLLPVAIGMALGAVASVIVTRLLESFLIGVSAGDPLTLIAVSALLLAIALLACYIPARRALKIDPMSALRYE